MVAVAVLYAKRGSVYNRFDVDVWDEPRDARRYPGGMPVIAHPPCRVWGRFKHRAKAAPGERELAIHAVLTVRLCGGVLEHPADSSLWKAISLPRPGEPPDKFGGFTIRIHQCDFGHRAIKPTWLYIVGVPRIGLPPMPPPGVASTTVERMWRGEREATPLRLASWLIELASRATPP